VKDAATNATDHGSCREWYTAPQQFTNRIKRQRRVVLAKLPAAPRPSLAMSAGEAAAGDLALLFLESGDEGAALAMATGLRGRRKRSQWCKLV